jgi:hypothetical protein
MAADSGDFGICLSLPTTFFDAYAMQAQLVFDFTVSSYSQR